MIRKHPRNDVVNPPGCIDMRTFEAPAVPGVASPTQQEKPLVKSLEEYNNQSSEYKRGYMQGYYDGTQSKFKDLGSEAAR